MRLYAELAMKDIDAKMRQAGLLDIRNIDNSILIDIKYATLDNFTGKVLYSSPFGVFLHSEVANAVAESNRILKSLFPNRRLIIFDAARPLSVQKEMFEIVRGTSCEPYIANPFGGAPGGFHNYGLAVDLSIYDLNEGLLDMGSDYDSFSSLSHAGNERSRVESGLLSPEAYANRMLLYFITGSSSLFPHPCEWWHYQLDYNESSKNQSNLLDF